MDENHLDLANEFPEFKEAIHTLKAQDAHFARLFSEYGELNRKIVRAEQRIELMSEEEEESLRRQRMHLKDQLFATLKAQA
jgi:uncharacterized protein YdcH (DUF465 family)